MNQPTYETYQIGELIFSFTSVGEKGNIRKIIRYERLDERLFNLAFGDQVEGTHFINYLSDSNNGDGRKIIATVVATIPIFFTHYPNGIVYIEGSDLRRTRLYHRIIKNYRHEVINQYEFLGGTANNLEIFDESQTYIYFAITKKSNYEVS